MTKIRWFMLCVLFWLTLPARGGEDSCLGLLRETPKPQALQVIGDKILVMEKATVHVYQREGLRFLYKFGKAGEGPGELPDSPFWTNSLYRHENGLFLEGFNKVLWYDLSGSYLKEEKKRKMAFKLIPVGEGYVGRSFPMSEPGNKKMFTALQLFDKSFNPIGELQQKPEAMLNQFGLFTMVPDPIQFEVSGNQIFVKNNALGCVIDVFDCFGKKLRQISHTVAPLPVDDAYRARAMALLKENFDKKTLVMVFVPVEVGEKGWQGFLQWADLQFPKNLPAIKDFWVTDKRIYVQTHKVQQGTDQFFVFSKEGQFLGERYLPSLNNPYLMGYYMAGIGARMSVFADGHYYYLMENEEEDLWEVHRVKVDE